jgi:hypothetical protein
MATFRVAEAVARTTLRSQHGVSVCIRIICHDLKRDVVCRIDIAIRTTSAETADTAAAAVQAYAVPAVPRLPRSYVDMDSATLIALGNGSAYSADQESSRSAAYARVTC